MRLIHTLIIFLSAAATAQTPEAQCKQVQEIAMMEKMAHARLNGNGTAGNEKGSSAGNNYDVKYYRCEWELDPSVNYVKGKITVYYKITEATASIAFDMMSPLAADSVRQRNTLLTKQFSNNTLTVNFPATVSAGVTDSVSIYYQGVPASSGFGSFIQSSHSGTPVLWSLSEPYGARDWWPCKNGLDDKADSIDILVTHPAAYREASNGIFQSETLLPGGTKKLTHWKHRYPIATYLICFAVTNYTIFNNSVQLGAVNLPMQTFCYPENLADFQAGTQNTLDALKLFSSYFGEYPFIKEKYGHVQFGWGGGMEHQTSTFVVNAGEGLCAHELGHQWFGDKITCASWKDIWLNEGFATFLAAFYGEQKYPASVISQRKNNIAFITSQPGGSVLVDDTTNVNRIFDSRLSYTKGSYLLYMLRWKLGDSVFFNALRQYQKDPKLAYGFSTTADLQRNLESVSGQNLQRFFDQWYRGQGYPGYNVEWSPLGSAWVRIKMNQVTSHASVPFFEMPVALLFKNAAQQKTLVVDNKTNGEIFIKNLGFIPDTVLIDPEYWLISKNNTSLKKTETINGTNIVQVYPNPFSSRFYVYLRNFTSATATINLYNSTGQLLLKKTVGLVNGSEYIELPGEQFAAGEYTLSVRTGDGFKFVRKMIKN